MTKKTRLHSLSTFALCMLITGSIDNIRNLPTTALFGNSLVFFLLFGAIVFLLPTAIVSAQLAGSYPEEGGIYQWVKHAYGPKVANLAIWLQWINTMVWFPSILSFIVGTAAFLIAPQLATNKTYLVSCILGVFWFLTLVNLRGFRTSAKLASFCTVVGMIVPMVIIIGLSMLWLFQGKPLQLHFSAAKMLPHLSQSQSWISLTAIMASFLGMELATVHVKHVNDANKKFPRALLAAVVIILTTMLLGSLAITFVLPLDNLHLVDGVMQAFSDYFNAFHLPWMIPVITVLLLIGSFGGMINWVISPAEGLLQAAEDCNLPAFITRENRFEVPANLLIIQAVVVSFMGLAFNLMPSVNGAYWLLTDLSTQLYMLMYVLMFLAAIRLARTIDYNSDSYSTPGGFRGMELISMLGLFGCLVSLIVGFIPPTNINVGSNLHYFSSFTIGMIVMMLPVLYLNHRLNLKNAAAQ